MNKSRFWQNIATTVCISMLAVACNNNTPQNTQSKPSGNNSQPSGNNSQQESSSKSQIEYGDLIIKDQSDYVMIPVYIQKEGGLLDRASYKRGTITNNFIFYHKPNGAINILLKKEALIDSFQLLETKNAGKPDTRVWFYGIIDQDTNEDKKINQDDAIIGYISDLAGQNLQQITPNNTRMLNWVVLPGQNALLIRILKDSNNDKKFTSEDTENFVRVNLDKPEIGQEIISDQINQEIRSYLTK
jgi:hypothetical protein